jgi:integrase
MIIKCPKCGLEFVPESGILNRHDLSKEQIEELNQTEIEKAIRSYRSKRTQYDRGNLMQTILVYFYDEFGVKYLLNYEIDEIEAWLHEIDNQKCHKGRTELQLSRGTKRKYRTCLLHVILHILKMNIRERNAYELIGLWTFILSDKFYELSETSHPMRQIIEIDPQEIKDLMTNLMITNICHYMIIGILAYSGCRMGGVIHLIVKNIHFDLGTFESQEKATKKTDGWNTYFLPIFFMEQLKTYILREQLQDNDYVFDISDKGIREDIVQKYKPEWWPHLLRHNIRMQWEKKGMRPIIAKFLLNHEPSSVDEEYLRGLRNYKTLRENYDRYFPY